MRWRMQARAAHTECDALCGYRERPALNVLRWVIDVLGQSATAVDGTLLKF